VTRTPLSAVVTTWNNATTLGRCLASLSFADEIVVVDSGSTDRTIEIARAAGARLVHHPFSGYGAQKQYAVDRAAHDWVLLLDADEVVTVELAAEIMALLATPPPQPAWRCRRREQLFWRWQRPGTRLVDAIRLFDRRAARLATTPIHAAVAAAGKAGRLKGVILHYGETDLHLKVGKINAYTSGTVRAAPGRRFLRLRMLFYPTFAFWREYLLRRQFVNGWAGFIAARSSAFQAFLKDAKRYDDRQPRAPDLIDSRRARYHEPPV